jgi:hypothetical protein
MGGGYPINLRQGMPIHSAFFAEWVGRDDANILGRISSDLTATYRRARISISAKISSGVSASAA